MNQEAHPFTVKVHVLEWILVLTIISAIDVCVCVFYLSGKNPERSFPIGRQGAQRWALLGGGVYKRGPVSAGPLPSLPGRMLIQLLPVFRSAPSFPRLVPSATRRRGMETTGGGHD